MNDFVPQGDDVDCPQSVPTCRALVTKASATEVIPPLGPPDQSRHIDYASHSRHPTL